MDYKDVEKQFDEKFPRMFAGSAGQYDRNGDTRPYYNDSVKEFIYSLLQQKDQEYTDKIKKYFSETHQMDLDCESLINFINKQ